MVGSQHSCSNLPSHISVLQSQSSHKSSHKFKSGRFNYILGGSAEFWKFVIVNLISRGACGVQIITEPMQFEFVTAFVTGFVTGL